VQKSLIQKGLNGLIAKKATQVCATNKGGFGQKVIIKAIAL
jgi:hypothetical protein